MSDGYKRPYESENPSNSRAVRGRYNYHDQTSSQRHDQSTSHGSPNYYHPGNRDHSAYRGRHGYRDRHDDGPPSSRSQSSYNYVDDRNRHSDRSYRPRQQSNVRSYGQGPSTSHNEGRQSSGRTYEQFSRDRQGQPTTHFEGFKATETERVEKGTRPERSLIIESLTTKPNYVKDKHGKRGRPVNLLTNYFRILKQPTWQLYQYRVDFSPEVLLRGLKNRLIFEQKTLFGSYLFDGTILVLMGKLNDDVIVLKSNDRDDNPIDITVKFTGVVPKNQCDFILNTIFRKSMSTLDLVLVRRNFFDPLNAISCFRDKYKLELWPGYITSIRQHENDILLCVEITTKVMRPETVLDILIHCYNADDRDFKTQFESKVLGMIVITGYNNKTHRITGVDFDRNASSTFDIKKEKTTFVEYYKNKYGITIKDVGQPLLISKASDRELRAGRSLLIALVPELCRPTGFSDEMRNNFTLMKDIAKYTKLNPKDRIDSLIGFNRRLQNSTKSQDNFNQWNFRLDKDLVKVPGRCLQNERIIFGNGKQIPTDQYADWATHPHKNQMYVSQHLINWTLIVPRKKEIANAASQFIDCLKKAGHGMGYEIRSPQYISLGYDDNGSYVDALNKAANGDPQLIMCIVSDQQKDRYSVIKKKCCVERAIPSQVIAFKTLKRQNQLMTVATKVIIQMNAKLGGVPWMVQIDHDDLMVVGYDICRDSKDRSKSYGAMVATMNMKLMQNYFTAVDFLTSGQQLSDNFGTNILKCVHEYGKQHGKFPTKIVVYRDGIGEGQINYVKEHEVKDIQAKLKPAYKNVPFQLGFLSVSKKINTRFFTTNKTNPSPGTVVDDVVTLPQKYEFFLISQFNRHGTVSPTSYNILHDDMQFTPDQWQELTYKMSHLYYNWCGTVSVPAVCHNAHRLASLVANFIHDRPSTKLEKQLYFL